MVDDGRKVYTRNNAMDPETGRTISTPGHEGRDRVILNTALRKAVFLGSLAVIIVAGLAAVVAAWIV